MKYEINNSIYAKEKYDDSKFNVTYYVTVQCNNFVLDLLHSLNVLYSILRKQDK